MVEKHAVGQHINHLIPDRPKSKPVAYSRADPKFKVCSCTNCRVRIARVIIEIFEYEDPDN